MQASHPLNERYAASVPVFSHYLRQLLLMLDKARQHAGGDEAALLRARLAPDMFDLVRQVQIAAGFAQRGCAPLAGLLPPSLGEGDAGDLDQLQQRVGRALAFIEGLDPAAIEASAGQRIRAQAGDAWLEFEAGEFIRLYALPNFFFHLGMAYALLRRAGVPLGKPDFDGFHRYPAGFSFPQAV
ncbi:DUF1993 family protein [soil metagenome]